ncbi:MAG: PilN domain-containing protein [Candidatus Omnitrophica bacterium]|nr:PilN domain-containing protein [Candidatus Omnitrophota bacterium]
MIEINVVPQELRKKKKKKLLPGGVEIPPEVIIGSIGGLFFLLILAHIGLLFLNVSKMKEHKALKQEWQQLLPQKEKVDGVVNDMRKLQNKHKAIVKVTGGEAIDWAQKLNLISNELPRGVWLTKIALTPEMLFIEGSAISKSQDELINVHKFTSNLKRQSAFMHELTELELGSIQRRSERGIDVADFLITTKLVGRMQDEVTENEE